MQQAILDRDQFRFMVADLHAAAWCLDLQSEPDDAVIARKFLSIHQFFLRNIDRERPELFVGVDRAALVDIVKRWMALYLHTLDELRARFPRTDDSADLVVHGRNWSELLAISFEGLDRIDVASRYAEYWAERSIVDPAVRASYPERRAFVGSPFYLRVDELKRDGTLLIVDAFTNGVTSYDLLAAIRALPDAASLEADFAARRWRIFRMTPSSRAALLRAAA